MAAVSSGKGCPKCGTTKKSGKRSCSARGGAWFNACGDAGDKSFNHTWAEGIQSCKRFSVSMKLQLQDLFRHVGVTIVDPLNKTEIRNTASQYPNIYRSVSISKADVTDSESCVRLGKAYVFISAMLTFFSWM